MTQGLQRTPDAPVGASVGARVEIRFDLALGTRVVPWRLVAEARGGALLGSGPAPASAADAAAAPEFGAPPEREACGKLLAAARAQLEAYGRGARRRFELPLRPPGTPFQRCVWQVLAALPWGATAGYGEFAARIGRPGAARAVGQACAANPLLILLPCHRVTGADGRPRGYAGGPALRRVLHELEVAGEHPDDPPGRPHPQGTVGVDPRIDAADVVAAP